MKIGPLVAHQGDCGLRAVSLTAAEKRKLKKSGGRLTLLRGETTGHAHVLVADDLRTELFGGLRVVVVGEEADLVHEEHDTIPLPPGYYAVWTPREYDGEDERPVLD